MTDRGWKRLVRDIAAGLCVEADLKTAEAYLWRQGNYDRLAATCWGAFVREKVNPVPDLALRMYYRKLVLDHGAFNAKT